MYTTFKAMKNCVNYSTRLSSFTRSTDIHSSFHRLGQ